MKTLLLVSILTLAACGPHVIPPKGQGYVEVDRAGGRLPHVVGPDPVAGPDHPADGEDDNGWSSDDNGDVSTSSDGNGGKS